MGGCLFVARLTAGLWLHVYCGGRFGFRGFRVVGGLLIQWVSVSWWLLGILILRGVGII